MEEYYSFSDTKQKVLKFKEMGWKSRMTHSWFKDKKFVDSVFYHTSKFNFKYLKYSFAYFTGELTEEFLLCPICKIRYKTSNMNIIGLGCGYQECINKNIGSGNSKKWTPEYTEKIINMKRERGDYIVQSNTMKKMILNGEWTPKSENRKRASKVKSDITGIKYRSNWELIFHEANQSLKYEYTRIKYVENGVSRVYITDFTDLDNKVIYEIKPSSDRYSSNVLLKERAANEWCKINGYTYKVLTEQDYNFYGRRQNEKV